MKTAEHRPAVRPRKYRHDMYTFVDLFSGFGGLTQAMVRAGFTPIGAANHNRYKVEIHEANHPEVEHWIADIANPDSSDYHSVADLPAADVICAGVTCTNHSIANTQRAYVQGLSLFDVDDPEWEEQATRSERDRATATCVLQYAGKHRPKAIFIECTTQLQSWGKALPGKRKIGDGTTYKWWLREFTKLGYRYQVLYLNSMFFGVPQSRDRLYIVMWLKEIPAPDLEHRPISWCWRCATMVEGVWTWKTGIPPSGTVCYGKQYNYRCRSCRSVVLPAATPSLYALDLSNLGERIGDKPLKKFIDKTTGETVFSPLAPPTMARADRCRQRFGEFPAVLMPAKANRGVERHPWQPMSTQTSQQETALLTGTVLPAHRHNGDGQNIAVPMDTVTSTHEKALFSTAALMAAAGNTFERSGSECRTRDVTEPLWAQTGTNSTGIITPPIALAINNFQGGARGANEPLPTQAGSETLGILAARVMPNRTHATSRHLGEPMETLVAGAGSGGLGVLSAGVVPFRRNTTPTTHMEAMPTVTAEQIPGLVTAGGRIQCNGSIDEAQYRTYPLDQPLGTVVGSAVTQGLLFSGWHKQKSSRGAESAPHPLLDPFGTLADQDSAALINSAWLAALEGVTLEDCFFRMLFPHEIGRGCGFDVTFGTYQGSFKVWGSARRQVDGFGNAVSPPVGTWIGMRLRAALHGEPLAV